MKTFKYNYCVLTNDVIYLSEEKITCRPAFDTCLENVNIDIYDNGIAELCGDEILFGFNFDKHKLSDIDEMPQDDYIKHYKGFKLFGFYLIKPYDYVPAGWYKIKERKPKKIILNKYKIVFI